MTLPRLSLLYAARLARHPRSNDLAALGYWGIGLPLAILLGFPLGLGGAGIWFGLASGLGVVGTLMVGRWITRERLGLTGVSRP